jgi:hypothetical protein
MKEYFQKPSTRALIDTVIFMLLITLIPLAFIKTMEMINVDPAGGLFIAVLFLAMLGVYSSRLEKYKKESTEDSDDQPLNS